MQSPANLTRASSRKNNAERIHQRTWLAAVVVALVLTGVAAETSAQRHAAPGIENFGRVNENYYRGAQPTAEQYGELRRLGVKAVIDLRDDRKAEAPDHARAAGLAYFNLPLEAGRPATDAQTAEFLKLVNDPANWPVYVHCDGGRTRTGALTAVYRIAHDGWTADRAYAEMLKYDFNGGTNTDGLFGGDARARQKRYVFAFYEQLASSQDPARAN